MAPNPLGRSDTTHVYWPRLAALTAVIIIAMLFSGLPGIGRRHYPGSRSFASQSGTRGCCSGAPAASARSREASIRAEVLSWYQDRYQDAEVDVVLTDYGCHVQADITKNGAIIKSVSYWGPGRIYD